jgi:hypothetical protein
MVLYTLHQMVCSLCVFRETDWWITRKRKSSVMQCRLSSLHAGHSASLEAHGSEGQSPQGGERGRGESLVSRVEPTQRCTVTAASFLWTPTAGRTSGYRRSTNESAKAYTPTVQLWCLGESFVACASKEDEQEQAEAEEDEDEDEDEALPVGQNDNPMRVSSLRGGGEPPSIRLSKL